MMGQKPSGSLADKVCSGMGWTGPIVKSQIHVRIGVMFAAILATELKRELHGKMCKCGGSNYPQVRIIMPKRTAPALEHPIDVSQQVTPVYQN